MMNINNASFNTDNLYFLNIFCLLYSSQLISESFVKHAGQLWGTIIINMTAHLRQNLQEKD